MKIFARGEKIRTSELQLKLSAVKAEWTILDETTFNTSNLTDFDLIFDLNFDDHQHIIAEYAPLTGKTIIVSATKKSLSEVSYHYGKTISCNLIGLNALPTFINRNLAEVCILNPSQTQLVSSVFEQLNWDYKLVQNRVGLVTPRIVFMIINEACYTLQEGTATINDIDISMKLGTNYPYGPFEWADKIGIKNIYETLDAIYQDTHDDRYKICPLLKTHYLQNELFYN